VPVSRIPSKAASKSRAFVPVSLKNSARSPGLCLVSREMGTPLPGGYWTDTGDAVARVWGVC